MTERRRTPRVGFTLIELLMVMAIIVILLALMTAGIARVMTRTQQAQTQQDIIELAQALEKFKAKFGAYPPSSLNSSNVHDGDVEYLSGVSIRRSLNRPDAAAAGPRNPQSGPQTSRQ